MQDMVINGTGNSRYMKSVSNFLSLYPTYEDFARALIAGSLPFDLNGVNEGGISQLGTPLNKTTLLKDTTAAMFGLGAGGTPDLAFEALGKYMLYTWWVQHNSVYYRLLENETSIRDSDLDRNYELRLFTATAASASEDATAKTTTVSVTYYDSISFDETTGTITPGTSHTVNISYSNYASTIPVLLGKYIKASDHIIPVRQSTLNTWYRIDSSAAYVRTRSTHDPSEMGYLYQYFIDFTSGVYEISTQELSSNTTEYKQSDNRNAYTDFGTIPNTPNGDYYRYAGVPFLNLLAAKKGVYTGSGSSQVIEFDSNPLMVFVQSDNGAQWIAAIQGCSKAFGSTAATVTWAANKITIAGTVITSGTTYHWAAVYL